MLRGGNRLFFIFEDWQNLIEWYEVINFMKNFYKMSLVSCEYGLWFLIVWKMDVLYKILGEFILLYWTSFRQSYKVQKHHPWSNNFR